jgi:uncharacterized protein YjbI with pentapeptide repeats
MADQEQLLRLRSGVKEWNQWRDNNPSAIIDLTYASLSRANLDYVNLSDADLSHANLEAAEVWEANLSGANLSGASLNEASIVNTDLSRANLTGASIMLAFLQGVYLAKADLNGADLTGAILTQANLSEADLSYADLVQTNLSHANLNDATLVGADLTEANLTSADLTGANLDGCIIFGISAWDVRLDGAIQTNLRITSDFEPEITVDNLEVAQFLYLMLHNEKIRAVLETITSKVVLILGRFSDERKPVLDALRAALREHPNQYVPVLFDFDLPAGRHILETVGLLAGLARFVIADITDPSMIRVELREIAPRLPSVPIQPLLLDSAAPMAEFPLYEDYPWVLPLYRYKDLPQLLAALNDVIAPAEQRIRMRLLR